VARRRRFSHSEHSQRGGLLVKLTTNNII